jgi:hypothetical protein
VGATSGAAVVPNPYRLQAGNADDTTSFENYPMFHTASLERPPRDGNGRFGAGNEPRLARFGWYRYKRYAGMGSILFMELVKAIGCCNG